VKGCLHVFAFLTYFFLKKNSDQYFDFPTLNEVFQRFFKKFLQIWTFLTKYLGFLITQARKKMRKNKKYDIFLTLLQSTFDIFTYLKSCLKKIYFLQNAMDVRRNTAQQKINIPNTLYAHRKRIHTRYNYFTMNKSFWKSCNATFDHSC
jgi:hypothetical protein